MTTTSTSTNPPYVRNIGHLASTYSILKDAQRPITNKIMPANSNIPPINTDAGNLLTSSHKIQNGRYNH